MTTPETRRLWSRTTATLFTAASATAIALATLIPSSGEIATSPYCVICGVYGGVDAFLNLLLFVPLGIGLQALGLSFRRASILMLLATLGIEALQFHVISGRDTSIGDLITNSLGGTLGFTLGKHLYTLLWPLSRTGARLALAWLGLWLGFQSIVAFSLVVVPPSTPYYGQIARRLRGSDDVFTGKVLSVAVGTQPIVANRLTNGDEVRRLLARRDGSMSLRLVVEENGPSPRVEIAAVTGRNKDGAFGFNQRHRELTFQLRTGADVLRLRTYVYSLRNVFPAATRTQRDTIVTEVNYGPQGVRVQARSREGIAEMYAPPRLSNGWRLFVPFLTYANDGPRGMAISVGFAMLLLFPAGFWAAEWATAKRPRLLVVALVSLAGVACGYAIVPHLFMLAAGDWWEWAASLGGIVTGFVTARFFHAVTRSRIRR